MRKMNYQIYQKGLSMKAIFCIDITKNKRNKDMIGEEFIVKEISEESRRDLTKNMGEISEIVEKSLIPGWLTILGIVCHLLGLISLFGIIKGISNVGIEKAFENAPFIFILCAILLIFSISLFIFARRKKEKTLKENNIDDHMEILEKEIEAIHEELGVPSDAKEIEILTFYYKDKKGTPKAVYHSETRFLPTPYKNICLKAFTTPGYFQIADNNCVYAFKLHELKSIKTIKKGVSIPEWYKEENFREGPYKKYKMYRDNQGGIHTRKYHILEIENNGEIYGIYFPCYELPIFEELTGISTES